MSLSAGCSWEPHVKRFRYEDIRKILIAKTIAESGSMQRAAKELRVTPSAVSQALAALERRAGAPLFLRDQGRTTPTEACLTLLTKAQPALSALDSLFEEEAKSFRIDYLDLGVFEGLSPSVVVNFAKQLRGSYPHARLNFTVGQTPELLQKLRSGELCTALVPDSEGLDRLRVQEVGRDVVGLFVSPTHRNHVEDWAKIEEMGFGVIAAAGDAMPPYLKRFIKSLGSKPRVTMACDSYEILRLAATSGLVAAVLPRRVALRGPGELVEVKKVRGRKFEFNGEHRILLATMDRCDEEEAKYLAGIAKECLRRE